MSNWYDLKTFDSKDIVSFESQIFKTEKLIEAVNKSFNSSNTGYYLSETLGQQKIPINVRSFSQSYQEECNEWWFSEGGDCEVLRPGPQGWQKGKIRIKLKVDVEFCLDEPESDQAESPLDDIRQMINE
ncbi:hypothetical protein NDA01_20760 [Trichocoleus desertorum AS-A10]|uniref:KGK domain-containing protein n=1 Tax=Trichocoleus desertorum TaxID=1481672 RepID=UPI0032989F25